MNEFDLMIEIQTLRYYVGRCIDGDDEFDAHELWAWLDNIIATYDSALGEEE